MSRTAQQLQLHQAAKPTYTYMQLDDIMTDHDIPKEHNLYAIVTDCTMPRLTRNGTHCAEYPRSRESRASNRSVAAAQAIRQSCACPSQTGCRTCG